MVTVLVAGVHCAHAGRQRGPEAQLDTLAVVVDGVGLGGECEGFGGVAAVEGHVLWHAGVVGCGGAALVDLLYGDDDCALGSALRVRVTSTVFSVTSVVSESSLSATV